MQSIRITGIECESLSEQLICARQLRTARLYGRKRYVRVCAFRIKFDGAPRRDVGFRNHRFREHAHLLFFAASIGRVVPRCQNVSECEQRPGWAIIRFTSDSLFQQFAALVS